ncbi:eukaryotic translation initiation factor 2-alpha kinase 1 [Sergentomyia squamirostris]
MLIVYDEEKEMEEWDRLKTVQEFDYAAVTTSIDRECGEASTREVDDNLMQILPSKPITPVSLLVESLLQQLCHLIEVDPMKSQRLYRSICEQLQQMNLIDDTWSMGEFEAMRSQYQKALFQLVAVARGQDLPYSLESVWPLASPHQLDWSRYHREFEEMNFIAGGGFGKVFRARNRLDGIDYAIKKVLIKSTSVDKVLSHLKEVRTFAGLNHINIVSYKAAWMEPWMAGDNAAALLTNNVSSVISQESESHQTQGASYSLENTYDDSVVFARSVNGEMSFESSQQHYQSVRIDQNRTVDIREHHPHLNLRWAMLYIQMSLCKFTLRDWLDRRNQAGDFSSFYAQFLVECQESELPCLTASPAHNSRCSKEHSMNVTLDIFNQLTSGLRYIHECKIVHHDIKPSNVFISVTHSDRLTVQLGDFGLACPLENSHQSDVTVGTPFYAAPEQIRGQCDAKSDIYSLGIILLELLIPFFTHMERVRVIDAAKCGQMPQNLPPNFIPLIERLLAEPSARPNATELHMISTRMKVSDGKEIVAVSELERKLSEKDEEILNLKSQVEQSERFKDIQLMSKDLEIQELHLKYEEEKKSRDEEIRLLREQLSSVTIHQENNFNN